MAKDWWKASARDIPRIVVEPPGPKSKTMHASACRYFHGLSSQVKLFPVCFEEGHGITLTDVDGNKYLDFSSGIYVTSLGHSHPKISEAVAHWAKKLMNCHDFTTPVKDALLQKMAAILPGKLNAIQFYSDGTAAVEAAIRAARAITNKHEFLSCFRDFHGKSMAAVSCAQMSRGDVLSYGPTRAPGFYLVPRPDPYRPTFAKPDGTIDTDAYLRFYDTFIQEGTAGNVAAFVLEPAQGWGGSIFPPEDFFASSSYGGNPMACAAALASLEVIEEDLLANVRMSPPLIMDEKYAELGLSIIEEAIAEVEKQFGYR